MSIRPLLFSALVALAACDGYALDDYDAGDDVPGEIVAALNTPAKVLCVRLSAVAEPTGTFEGSKKNRVHIVTPGSDLVLDVGRQPETFVTISGDAWEVPCGGTIAAPTAPGGDPHWIAEGVRFENQQGATVRVPLIFQINSQPVADIEWDLEITQIDTDGTTTVALDVGKHVWAWGGAWGPDPVDTWFIEVLEVKTAGGHICGRRADGLWCFNGPGYTTPPGAEGNPFFSPGSAGAALVTTDVTKFAVGVEGVYWLPRVVGGQYTSGAFFTGWSTELGGYAVATPIAAPAGVSYVAVEAFPDGVCFRESGWAGARCRSTARTLGRPNIAPEEYMELTIPFHTDPSLPAPWPMTSLTALATSRYAPPGSGPGRFCFNTSFSAWWCNQMNAGVPSHEAELLRVLFAGSTAWGVPRVIVGVRPGPLALCALNDLGAVRCDSLRPGVRGTITPPSIEGILQPVDLPKKAVQITGDQSTYCALLIDHTVWCWGDNTYGAIGDGTFETRFTPVRIIL